MNGLRLLEEAAAVTRLTQLVVEDEITREFREWVEEKTGPDSKLTYLVNCPYCTSVWAGLVVPILPRFARRALALSGLAIAARHAGEVAESWPS